MVIVNFLYYGFGEAQTNILNKYLIDGNVFYNVQPLYFFNYVFEKILLIALYCFYVMGVLLYITITTFFNIFSNSGIFALFDGVAQQITYFFTNEQFFKLFYVKVCWVLNFNAFYN